MGWETNCEVNYKLINFLGRYIYSEVDKGSWTNKLLEWMATAKESQDQSNSSDVLITMENLEEYISYQGLTVVGVVSASDPPQALKDMLKAKNAPSLSGGP
jgi:hypothetical protein